MEQGRRGGRSPPLGPFALCAALLLLLPGAVAHEDGEALLWLELEESETLRAGSQVPQAPAPAQVGPSAPATSAIGRQDVHGQAPAIELDGLQGDSGGSLQRPMIDDGSLESRQELEDASREARSLGHAVASAWAALKARWGQLAGADASAAPSSSGGVAAQPKAGRPEPALSPPTLKGVDAGLAAAAAAMATQPLFAFPAPQPLGRRGGGTAPAGHRGGGEGDGAAQQAEHKALFLGGAPEGSAATFRSLHFFGEAEPREGPLGLPSRPPGGLGRSSGNEDDEEELVMLTVQVVLQRPGR